MEVDPCLMALAITHFLPSLVPQVSSTWKGVCNVARPASPLWGDWVSWKTNILVSIVLSMPLRSFISIRVFVAPLPFSNEPPVVVVLYAADVLACESAPSNHDIESCTL